MKITIEIPNPPKNQEIIEIPLHFCGGKVVEAGGYGFEERKEARWVPNAVGVYRCSNCHSNMKLKKGRPPKYCDECGHFMVPEEEGVLEKNCNTCRFTPPGKKWPCEDCLYNDRWETQIR